VSIEPLSAPQLPMPVPQDFALAAAFDLELGNDPLRAAAQLAIPVSPTIPSGTNVVFARAGQIPELDGTLGNYWLEVESGVVDQSGVARTSPPPSWGTR